MVDFCLENKHLEQIIHCFGSLVTYTLHTGLFQSLRLYSFSPGVTMLYT